MTKNIQAGEVKIVGGKVPSSKEELLQRIFQQNELIISQQEATNERLDAIEERILELNKDFGDGFERDRY